MTRQSSPSLLDEEPQTGFSLVEAIADHKPRTKAEQSFHRLVNKIQRKRDLLKQWQDYVVRYHQRLAGELVPVQEELRAGQRQMVDLLDELLSKPAPGRRLGKVQRAKLRQLLLDVLGSLLEEGGDEALEALHDKYADVSHAELQQSEMELTQAMLEGVFGLEVGDDHKASNTEELLQHAQRKMEERAQEQERLAQERQAARASKRSKAAAAKAEAAQAKRDQAAQEVGQSVREVYRKLASALHPDRETDAEARQRKTLLMQRVNSAYQANDLLTLLGLQLEIEQIDAEHLSSVSPERLAHYNQVLKEQLAELEVELEHCIMPFQHTLGWGWGTVTPAVVDRQLSLDIAQAQRAARELQADLVAFRDPAKLRDFLADYPLEDEGGGMDEFFDLLDIFQMPPPSGPPSPKKKRRRG